MDLRVYALVLSISLLQLECNGTEGPLPTLEKELQLSRKLHDLKKSAVNLVKTIYGETYRCVDFYKQPAFNHPLLKNHSFHYEMKPNYYLTGGRKNKSFKNIEFGNIWLNGKGCPHGTVPIKRIIKDNSNINSLTHRFSLKDPGLHYARVRTRFRNPEKYNGAQMSHSLHEPQVVEFQSSGVQMTVQGGSDYIIVGSMVNPNLNSDSRVRGFIFTHTDTIHCYNIECPGFVLTRSDFPVDNSYRNISVIGGPIFATSFRIFRDVLTGNWWLAAGKDYITIGFWPKNIFTNGLNNLASHIEWGGEVYSPFSIPSPKMGTGEFNIHYDSYRHAFCANLSTINEANQITDAYDLIEYSDVPDSYSIFQLSDNVKGYGHLFFYGGPGGITGN